MQNIIPLSLTKLFNIGIIHLNMKENQLLAK